MFGPLLVAAVVCTARADETAETAEPAANGATAASTAEAQLASAIRAYAQGDIDGARAQLQALLAAGPNLPPKVRTSALAYLGDVLYSEEGAEAARPILSALLDEAPGFVMDPFEHPEPVCRYFDTLRAARASATVTATWTRGPPPYWSLVPGGLHWYAQDEIATGMAITLTQAGLLVGNVVLYQTLATRPKVDPDDPDEDNAYQAHRLANNMAAGAFIASLLVPPAIEFARWSTERPPVGVSVGPGALLVHGSF